MNPLQVIAAIFVLFFLPGYTFITMLFPKRGELDLEYDQLYRIGIGMAMSIVISIMVGFVLGATNLFYASYLWITLINLSIIFYLIGFYRGGYPTIRKLLGLEKEDKYDRLIYLQELLKERKKLIKKLEEVDRIIRLGAVNREYHEKKRKEIIKSIMELDEKIEKMRGVVYEE